MKQKLPRGTLDRLWADSKNWNGGLYSCKEDPRVVVPKRIRWAGTTVNFSHPYAWRVLGGFVLVVFVSVMTLVFAGIDPSIPFDGVAIGLGVLTAFIAAVVGVSRVYSDPARYEE